jgi:hypothetical protein
MEDSGIGFMVMVVVCWWRMPMVGSRA